MHMLAVQCVFDSLKHYMTSVTGFLAEARIPRPGSESKVKFCSVYLVRGSFELRVVGGHLEP